MLGKTMRKRIIQFLLIIILSSINSACSFIFSGAEEKTEKNSKKANKTPSSVIKSFVRTAVNKNGDIEWVLKAREGREFGTENRIYLTDFIMMFYRDGKIASRLRARRGIIDGIGSRKNMKIVAKRLVFLKSETTGRTLETEELYGNDRNKIIFNEVFNRITEKDGSVLVGTHLWAHNDLRIFKLRNVKGEAPATNRQSRSTKTNKASNNTKQTNTKKGNDSFWD